MFESVFDANPCGVGPKRNPLWDDVFMTEKQLKFQKDTVQKVFRYDKFTFSQLVTQLYIAYRDACKHKRDTEDEINFEFNLAENIRLLAEDIWRRTYEPSRGIAFIVKEPVCREVFAAPFRDRVVHHLLYNLSYYWWDPRFIEDSCSCRQGKGNITAWKKLQKDLRKVSEGGKHEVLVMKLDISGYFMSMNRELLFDAVAEGLDEQFKDASRIRAMTRYLWHAVIFDDPTRDVKIRGKRSDWKKLPINKSLFHQKPGHGIVIGNLTSQLLSNIFLDEFDRFVKYQLKYTEYVRYVDDATIVIRAEDKEKLMKDMEQIRAFLLAKGLKLHPKKCRLVNAKIGVEFVGAKVFVDRVLPSNRLLKHVHKEVYEIEQLGKEDLVPFESYMGMLKHYKAKKLKYGSIDKVAEELRKRKKDGAVDKGAEEPRKMKKAEKDGVVSKVAEEPRRRKKMEKDGAVGKERRA